MPARVTATHDRRERPRRAWLETLEPRVLLSGQGSAGDLLLNGAATGASEMASPVLRISTFASDASSGRLAAMTRLPANGVWDVPLPNAIYSVHLTGMTTLPVVNLEHPAGGLPVDWQTNVTVTNGRLHILNQSNLLLTLSELSITPTVTATATATASTLSLVAMTAPASTSQTLSGQLQATPDGSHDVALTWAAQDGAAGYWIERATDGQHYSLLTRTGANDTSFTDTQLAAGTTYSYRLRTVAADGSVSSAFLAAQAKTSDFVLYDSLAMRGKPNMTQIGFTRFLTGNGAEYNQVINGVTMKVPTEAVARQMADRAVAAGNIVAIDIEDWPSDIRYNTKQQVQDTINKFTQIIDWMHDEQPNLKVGIYGVLPTRDYWTPYNYEYAKAHPESPWARGMLPAFTKAMDDWHAANAFLAPLAAKVDVIFPSLYTFYDDPQGWQWYAQDNIAEAQQYGKPVVPFLWDEYHNSNATLRGHTIPEADFRQELEFVYAHAEGAVLWTWSPTQLLSPDVGWWKATTGFLQAHQIKSVAP